MWKSPYQRKGSFGRSQSRDSPSYWWPEGTALVTLYLPNIWSTKISKFLVKKGKAETLELGRLPIQARGWNLSTQVVTELYLLSESTGHSFRTGSILGWTGPDLQNSLKVAYVTKESVSNATERLCWKKTYSLKHDQDEAGGIWQVAQSEQFQVGTNPVNSWGGRHLVSIGHLQNLAVT